MDGEMSEKSEFGSGDELKRFGREKRRGW